MTLAIQLIIITLASYFLVKQVIKHAHSLHLLDIPNERSHHCNIIPSGAGIGFVAALFVGLISFELQLILEYWFIFLSILIVFAMGIYDDRHDVSAKLKFIAIFLAVGVLFFNGVVIDSLGVWYGYDISLVWWIALPFSMFALAGFTNALNLIDGIDGLSSSISVVILLFFAFLGFEYEDNLLIVLSSFTIASIIGFMFLNWNPAKIFMGDSGSLSLGFIISVLAVISLEYIHPVAILYLTAIPILDTLIVMIRRIRRGKSPFSPDKTHLHHILVKFFDNNVPQTVSFLVLMQIIFSGIGYALLDSMSKGEGKNIPLFALIGFVLLFVVFYMIFTGIKKRQKMIDEKPKKPKRNL
jgi:UDP-GlcNAc:undecaprenyl-phosphate GlcNAc-1-phosphate transferase